MNGTTLTLRNVDAELIRLLKYQTGASTASKAFIVAARKYPSLVSMHEDLIEELNDARHKIYSLNAVIESLDSACRSVIETTGQQSLID